MRLKYYLDGRVLEAGTTKFHESWYDDWLQTMLEGSEAIWFIVEDSTDVEIPEGFKQRKPDVYGYCTACGSHEVKLDRPQGTMDLSDIGESDAYPVGHGCELCG